MTAVPFPCHRRDDCGRDGSRLASAAGSAVHAAADRCATVVMLCGQSAPDAGPDRSEPRIPWQRTRPLRRLARLSTTGTACNALCHRQGVCAVAGRGLIAACFFSGGRFPCHRCFLRINSRTSRCATASRCRPCASTPPSTASATRGIRCTTPAWRAAVRAWSSSKPPAYHRKDASPPGAWACGTTPRPRDWRASRHRSALPAPCRASRSATPAARPVPTCRGKATTTSPTATRAAGTPSRPRPSPSAAACPKCRVR